jgi:hypothetical protein
MISPKSMLAREKLVFGNSSTQSSTPPYERVVPKATAMPMTIALASKKPRLIPIREDINLSRFRPLYLRVARLYPQIKARHD